MRNLSRSFFPMLILVLGLVLGFGACGKGCKKTGELPDKSVLKLIPSGQNILVGIDWQKIKGSSLGEKLQKQIPPQAAPFSEEIQKVTLGVKIASLNQEPKEVVAIVSGSLDPVKMIALMVEEAKKNDAQFNTDEYEGVKIYTTAKDPSNGMAFVDGKGAMGSKSTLKKVIDLSKGKGTSVIKDDNLLALFDAVDIHRMIWAVGVVPEGVLPEVGAPGGASPVGGFSNVKGIDLALDISEDLNIDLGITVDSPEAAEQMETTVNSYKTLFGTSLAMKNPNLGKVLNNMDIGVSGPRVAVSIQLDQATLEQLSQPAETLPTKGLMTN